MIQNSKDTEKRYIVKSLPVAPTSNHAVPLQENNVNNILLPWCLIQ